MVALLKSDLLKICMNVNLMVCDIIVIVIVLSFIVIVCVVIYFNFQMLKIISIWKFYLCLSYVLLLAGILVNALF